MFKAGFLLLRLYLPAGLWHGCRYQSPKEVVRGAGLEPAQYCYRQDLNLVRLPISPPARLKITATMLKQTLAIATSNW